MKVQELMEALLSDHNQFSDDVFLFTNGEFFTIKVGRRELTNLDASNEDCHGRPVLTIERGYSEDEIEGWARRVWEEANFKPCHFCNRLLNYRRMRLVRVTDLNEPDRFYCPECYAENKCVGDSDVPF